MERRTGGSCRGISGAESRDATTVMEPVVFDILEWGLSHLRCRWSGGIEEALLQQVELGAAVHLALEHLEAVDLALGLAVAPR